MISSSQDSLSGKHILVVEDDYLIVLELIDLLVAAGATPVGPASTVAQALDVIASTQELDGAVLDVNLHGEMVYPVADALSARGVHFVFATGYDQSAIPARYQGIVRCEKPVDPAQVTAALCA